MKTHFSHSASKAGQDGATLIIALLILLAMTVLGTSSMGTLTMQERMISNMRDENVAFQAAESGLAACELNLRDNNPAVSQSNYQQQGNAAANAGGSYTYWWDDPSIWSTFGIDMPGAVDRSSGSRGKGGVSADPICVREHIGLAPDDLSFESRSKRIGAEMYTVTSKGFGAEQTSESVVQSVVFARYK